MKSYPIYSKVSLSYRFLLPDGVTVPTLTKVHLQYAGGDVLGTDLTLEAGTLTVDGTGLYTGIITVNRSGKWRYRFDGKGATFEGSSGDIYFQVDPTGFSDPSAY